jgi:phosphatidylserine/phosphatidylglycerophosphate/cardiolipin synthase-like enzyme
VILALALFACNPPPSAEDLAGTRAGRVDFFFNDPGTRPSNLWQPDFINVMVNLIDNSTSTLDCAAMGFTLQPLIDAIIRAHDRGVRVRFVGDSGHLNNTGYIQLQQRHIPIMVGNFAHIMHNKFLVADSRFVFAGTGNWSKSDLRQNWNNFVVMDSPEVARDFTDEFEQMFAGRFGYNKVEIDNGRSYTLGDTTIEVWFSPNEDVLGRMLEVLDGAEESVRFTIFAMTKDQVGGLLVRKQEEFDELDASEGVDLSLPYEERRRVSGVIDQSQLHSNGQYHEAYRMLQAGIDLRMDGNDNSEHPGDYQAGGGRLHSKTMIIDPEGENPTVITGSFNWSAAATQSNDEFLLVMHGKRVADAYVKYFDYLYGTGRPLGSTFVGDGPDDIQPGDVVINEVMWYGVNSQDADGNDEFIELRNLTDRDLDLSMWQIANEQDIVVGLVPGSKIPAGGTFLILDHTLEPYQDGVPQDEVSAFRNGDLVLNSFNDNRQSRLYLKDGNLELHLRDPLGSEVDTVGDGGAAFAGGPGGSAAYSMERNDAPGDGADPASWHACRLSQGGENVNDAFKREVVASPGESNSR